jgi:hypothetical protein
VQGDLGTQGIRVDLKGEALVRGPVAKNVLFVRTLVTDGRHARKLNRMLRRHLLY